MPPTPQLPAANRSGLAPLTRGPIFFAQFGAGPPVLFLHGGLANSNYWGSQVASLSDRFTVVAMDTHGHGRSPLSVENFSYRLFARDVVDLLDFLKIGRTAVVGWSDGAITGLQLVIEQPSRVSALFAFGANATPAGVKREGGRSPIFAEFSARTAQEYRVLSPQPGRWPALRAGLQGMWQSEPNFTSRELEAIRLPVVIADGQHDEIIKREDTEFLARSIDGSKLVLEPDVSHFAMLQEPEQFSRRLGAFLAAI